MRAGGVNPLLSKTALQRLPGAQQYLGAIGGHEVRARGARSSAQYYAVTVLGDRATLAASRCKHGTKGQRRPRPVAWD